MSVCCDCCVLSGRGLCDELITRPEESDRLWCVAVCYLETSSMRSQTSIVTERYITGCTSCMPLIVTVNTIAECPRTDCNIYWEGNNTISECTDTCKKPQQNSEFQGFTVHYYSQSLLLSD